MITVQINDRELKFRNVQDMEPGTFFQLTASDPAFQRDQPVYLTVRQTGYEGTTHVVRVRDAVVLSMDCFTGVRLTLLSKPILQLTEECY